MSSDLGERRIVTMTGDGEPTQMEVYLELDVEDKAYGLLIPMDLPVHLVRTFQETGSDVLDPVDADVTTSLTKELDAALRPYGLKSENRDGDLFLIGDPNDEFFDDPDVIEVSSDDGEEEEYAVLLELETGENTYLVITPIVPDLYPIEFTGDSEARLLEDNELSDLEETFQAALSAVEEDEE